MERLIAYFSMEIAIESGMPTYSGGLGVLAGDIVRTAADMQVPMVGVTLLHRKGYFFQRLGPDGTQREEPMEWNPEDRLELLPQRASVELEGKTVYLRAWKCEVAGHGGFTVPVYFLDTHLPENPPEARELTDYLYGGDSRYRLCQETIFGIGGVRMLRVLGYEGITRYHMNEGHAALLTLDLLGGEARKAGRNGFGEEDLERVRAKCAFTTHTPLSAGHDQFSAELVEQVLNRPEMKNKPELFYRDGRLDMTHLALNLSHFVNGVTKRHGEISSRMFSRPVEAVTNGVHAGSWTSEPFQKLYDRHIPGWREDNFSLRDARTLPSQEVWAAHREAKRKLLERVKAQTGLTMEEDVLTIGFARRATAYKRPALLLHDLHRLKQIAHEAGRLQVVYAGKAHPHDQEGKDLIRKIFQAKEELKSEIPVAYLQNYDMEMGRLMTAGSDVWLNTPQPPLEASGTSGMKAALNGVPSLSVLDGWWLEGHQEGITGWAIGSAQVSEAGGDRTAEDAASLYEKLQSTILPLFYKNRDGFMEVMRQTIALNGAFFHTQRMMQQYVLEAYFR